MLLNQFVVLSISCRLQFFHLLVSVIFVWCVSLRVICHLFSSMSSARPLSFNCSNFILVGDSVAFNFYCC